MIIFYLFTINKTLSFVSLRFTTTFLNWFYRNLLKYLRLIGDDMLLSKYSDAFEPHSNVFLLDLVSFLT